MTGKLLLLALILLPFVTGACVFWLRRGRPQLVPRVSVFAAVLLVLLVSIAIPDTSLDLFSQREFRLLSECRRPGIRGCAVHQRPGHAGFRSCQQH